MAKSKTVVFKPVCGAYKKKDAQIIGSEMYRIMNAYGDVKPVEFVNHARSTSSPIHRFFEWDDKIAGEKYRIEQAKYMIRHITIEVLSPKGKTIELNIASSVVRPGVGAVYTPTINAMKIKSDRRQLIAQGWRELQSFLYRYESFVEFESITSVIRLQIRKHP